jgi:cell division protein ZapA (FtsZ GTPase activity inhibitor)
VSSITPSEDTIVTSTLRENQHTTDTNKVPELTDLFVSRNLSSSFIDVTEEFDLVSDHSPIALTLSETIIKKGRNPTLPNYLTDWDTFRETLANRLNLLVALTTTDELEDEVQKFVTDIQHSAWEATPLLTTRIKGNTYPQEIREKNCRQTQNQEKVAND